MIPKPLDQIGEADLQALVDDRREEGTRIDFKRELPRDDHDGRKAFYSDVCAFANTSGGDLVYGINEVDGFATGLVPQALPSSPDGYVLKLTSGIRDHIEPGLHGVHIHVVPLSAGGHAVVVRVPRSASGLHRYRRDGQFYVRRSRSNEQLDVPGIVSRVSDTLGREDRVSAFFARRYADILANQHSINLGPGPKLVVHLLPARDFLSGEEMDVWSIPEGVGIPFLVESYGHSPRNTVDGRAFFSADNGVAEYFTLFIHSGVVEACMDLIGSDWPEDVRKVDLGHAEASVLRLLTAFSAGALVSRSTDFPFVARVALLGTNGQPFMSGAMVDMRRNPNGLEVLQRLPVLTLPEVLIEQPDADIEHLMHAAFLRMWQAWGYAKSSFYVQKDGKWRRQAR